ncbi:MAG: DNA polymerase III subunit alpha [Alphaproteobacteria bacterium]|nr:DNA polymerase III subunit alpha [Alphaproteobacteria bacterium]
MDGLNSPAELVKAAKDAGQTALAITDHGTLSSHREMQIACKEQGIKPILGVEAYISPTDRFDRSSKTDKSIQAYNHIILLAKNKKGLENINILQELAWNEGFYHKPRIDREVLKQYAEGIIVLSGCLNGLISKAIEKNEFSEAKMVLKDFKKTFGDDFYIEVQSHNPQEINSKLLEFADELKIKAVATGDAHFAKEEDRVLEEAMLILSTSPKMDKDADFDMSRQIKDINDRLNYLYPDRRISFQNYNLFIQSRSEIESDFNQAGISRTDIYENTMEIADKVEDYDFYQGLDLLPVPKTDADERLRELAEKGLESLQKASDPIYTERLDEELGVIASKNFASYFLVVADMINWAKDNGIKVGPGRGSAAGSLVCYALGITDVDPIKYDLLFFRFINPERNDFPDIDTDFEDRRRKEVKDYLKKKFKHVASISTYTYFKDKGVVRDAARVFMVPLQEVNRALKPVDTFEDFIDSPNTKEFRMKYPEVVWLAERLRGRIRSVGVHAAGVVVAKDDIRKFAPVESREDAQDKVSGRIPVVAYDMDTVADIGLIKLDALGLKTLSVISDTVKSIKERTGKEINLSDLPLDDPKVYKMLSDGYTKGVFQAEATPYTNLLIKMGVDKFEDLAASNALVRPGAMNTVGASYIKRKHGDEAVQFIHPIMKPFTENTYGVIIYQEQVMQACVHLGGMTWSEADKVRKIIGKKKDAKEFDQFKDRFIDGASKHISKKQAETLWHTFEAHAGYSFNRSHAVAYSMLSYYTAWLKTYYPLEFMFSILKNENDKDARTEYLIESKRLGLRVSLPHINESDVYFSLQKDKIVFGLAEVKFISDSIANKIIEKRPYANYNDFIEKASKKGSGINSRAIAALNSIGGAAFEDNPRTGNEKDNYYEYLGIPTFNLEGIPPRIKAQARPIEDFEDLGSFVMFGMVKSIKRGNGWARVELVDETGSIGLFHHEQTQIETNQMYFILVGDNRIARYIKVSDIDPKSDDLFVDYLYRKEYNLEEDEYTVVNFTPYTTKAGKTMSHIVLSNRDKELTRVIVFPTMYKFSLAKMREGMKCKPVLSTLDDGTLMVKEIK